MKKNMMRSLAMLLALVMLLGTVPFAMAEGETDGNEQDTEVAVCEHTETETRYVDAKDGTHMVEVVCLAADCGKQLSADSEACADLDADIRCDRCGGEMEKDADCEHENVDEEAYKSAGNGMHYVKWCLQCDTGLIAEDCVDTNGDNVCDDCYGDIPEKCAHDGQYRPTVVSNGDRTHSIKYLCVKCGEPVAVQKKDCADADEDQLCDTCGGDMNAKLKPSIVCPEDGVASSSNDTTMTFSLANAETDGDVVWSFTASGSAQPELSDSVYYGDTASVNVATANGRGVAAVTATAQWSDGEATGTFYVSFYDRGSYTVYVKEGTKAFGFGKTGVFEKANNVNPSKISNYSLYSFMTDGCATRATLYENTRANEDVGSITCKTSGKFYQYDPDGYNDYGIADLDKLTFTVLGQGSFKLNFELYEMAGGKGRTTTKGTINIVVGDPGNSGADVIYRTDGRAVTFEANDFVDYWEAHANSASEKLDYVKFDVDDRNYGALYLDSSLRGMVTETYKFEPDFTKSKTNVYDLDEVTYRPNPNEEDYTETIAFVAYGTRSNVIKGVVTIIVGEELPFTDVKLQDWFFDEVAYVYEEGIMNGTTDTTFAPNATLTRGMVVTMLWRLDGSNLPTGEGAFTDVASDAWYAKAVQWAAQNGIVKGVSEEEFAPDAPITREQLAAILYRYAKYDKMATSYAGTTLEDFADDNKVSSYAEEAMKWAVYMKIMEGSDNYLNPKGNATRAEAAAMFQRFTKNGKLD